MENGSIKQWFALRTAAGREKAVAEQLRYKGYEEFLPVYQSVRQWSDRSKRVELPLFPGYLFCRFDVANRLPILMTPNVKLVVGYGKTPTPVKDEEVEALRTVVASGAETSPWPFLEVGQRVTIRDGALRGVEGILLQLKSSWRIVVSVELLRRSVAVEVDRAGIVPVAHAGAATLHLDGVVAESFGQAHASAI